MKVSELFNTQQQEEQEVKVSELFNTQQQEEQEEEWNKK